MLIFGGFGVLPKGDEDDEDEDEDEDGAEGEGEGEEKESSEGGSSEQRGPSVSMGWFDDLYTLDCSTWRWSKVRPFLYDTDSMGDACNSLHCLPAFRALCALAPSGLCLPVR